MTTPTFQEPADAPVDPQASPDPATAPQDATGAAVAPVAPPVGSVVLHDTYDARQASIRALALLVIGTDGDRVHAVTLGWADEYADLAPGDYRPA